MKSLVLAVSLIATVLCSVSPGQIRFQDVTEDSGISHTGWTWGASWGDFSGNGLPDLWTGNHGNPNTGRPNLYLNLGQGNFVEVVSNVWTFPTYMDLHGGAWADYDNDSDKDLLILTGANGGAGMGANIFFLQRNGFLGNIAESLGLSNPLGRGRTPLWLDFDEDGVLDVVMSNAAHPNNLAPSAVFRGVPSVGSSPSFWNVNNQTGFQVPGSSFCVLSDVTLDRSLGSPGLERELSDPRLRHVHLALHRIVGDDRVPGDGQGQRCHPR